MTHPKNLDDIMKQAHGNISPEDSWQALRGRIDQTLRQTEIHRRHSLRRWKWAAYSAAACLLVSLGGLWYCLGLLSSSDSPEPIQPVLTNYRYFTTQELSQRNTAFRQVREVFGQHSPWIMIGLEGRPQMGVDPLTSAEPQNQAGAIPVIIRLAISQETTTQPRNYYDLVAVLGQTCQIDLPLPDGGVMSLQVLACLDQERGIHIEIQAPGTTLAPSLGNRRLDTNRYALLGRIQIQGYQWVIEGIGQRLDSPS